MAEPIGLTAGLLSLATLFSTCIDCFEFYKTTKDCGEELRTLVRQLDLEEARLLLWAERVGLVHLSPQTRHAALEELEPAVVGALSEIKLLLAEANKVQDRFGLRPTTNEVVADEVENAVVSKNSRNIFRTNYNRFCTRFETRLSKPKLSLRIRWAITDGTKFRGLIIKLKDLIDGLYSLFSMRTDPRNDPVQDDIMEIIDLSELHIIEDACERSAYRAWSESARLAIDRTEMGTIDRRTMNPSEEQLRYRRNDGNTVYSGTSPTKEPAAFALSPKGWHVKSFFMPTDSCTSYAGSCEEETFADSVPLHGYEHNRHVTHRGVGSKLIKHLSIADFTCKDIDDLLDLGGPDEDGEYPGPRQLGIIFIHIAPCMRLIRTALMLITRIPKSKQAELWGFKIRIDDRLYSSCSHLASQNIERLRRVILQLNSIPSSWHVDFAAAGTYLDIEWIEKRLYYIEESEVSMKENSGSPRNLHHIFESSSYEDPKEDVAAIFVIGEEAQVAQIMSMPPFPTCARQPRAPEVYKMSNAGYQMPWKRDFIGTFIRNSSLKKVQDPVAPISPAASVTSKYQQRPSIDQPAGKKRKVASSESSHGYNEVEEAVD